MDWTITNSLRHARRAGLERVIAQAEVGEPAAEIARVASEREADMVVMSCIKRERPTRASDKGF